MSPINENVYKIKINLKDERLYADVVTCLYQPGLFNELWKLREKYKRVLSDAYPCVKNSANYIWKLKEEDLFYPLKKDLRKIRRRHLIPYNFEKLLFQVLTIGVISDGDYKRAYYHSQVEGSQWSDDLQPVVHSIVLHPAANKDDVINAFNEYQRVNGIKTKSAKKLGKNREEKFQDQDSKNVHFADYYHRILTLIQDKPLTRKVKSDYKVYCEYMILGSYIPLVLKAMTLKNKKYAWITQNDYKKMKTLSRRGGEWSVERDKAQDFIETYEKTRERVRDRVKKIKRIIKQNKYTYSDKPV